MTGSDVRQRTGSRVGRSTGIRVGPEVKLCGGPKAKLGCEPEVLSGDGPEVEFGGEPEIVSGGNQKSIKAEIVSSGRPEAGLDNWLEVEPELSMGSVVPSHGQMDPWTTLESNQSGQPEIESGEKPPKTVSQMGDRSGSRIGSGGPEFESGDGLEATTRCWTR